MFIVNFSVLLPKEIYNLFFEELKHCPKNSERERDVRRQTDGELKKRAGQEKEKNVFLKQNSRNLTSNSRCEKTTFKASKINSDIKKAKMSLTMLYFTTFF